MQNERPAHQVRLGTVKGAIWKNETSNGVNYNTTFVRPYRDEKGWKDADSFGRDDLLVLAKVADLAHSWICEQKQEERGEQASRNKPAAK